MRNTRHQVLALSTILFGLAACEPSFEGVQGIGSSEQGIYYGTRDPQNVSLSDGQMLAIGWFHTPGNPAEAWCSGTVIAPRVVASADHCLQGVSHVGQVGFGVGTMPTSPVATFSISEVYRHSSLDVAMFILGEDATVAASGLVPISYNQQNPSQWVNQHLDAAGYGQTHDGSIGRYFASVLLETVYSSEVIVNGQGQQGICFGDSGGPLLSPNAEVIAVESHGDSSCVGQDHMVRLDAVSSWIDPIIAEHGGGAVDECDGLDYLGRCNGDIAEWCQDGQIVQHDCSQDGMTCGWVDDEIGYYCVEPDDDPDEPDDPCDGLDYLGRCNGDIAEWCQDGQIVQYDCSNDGMTCGWVNDEIGYYCVEDDDEPGEPGDECDGLDHLGRCDGDIAEWCEDGQIVQYDCSDDGLTCGWVDAETGYYCVEPGDDPGEPDDPCADLDYLGRCNGDVAEWCDGGTFYRHDCSEAGMTCGWIDDEVGYFCVDPSDDDPGDDPGDDDTPPDDTEDDPSDESVSSHCQALDGSAGILSWGLLLLAFMVFSSHRQSLVRVRSR